MIESVKIGTNGYRLGKPEVKGLYTIKRSHDHWHTDALSPNPSEESMFVIRFDFGCHFITNGDKFYYAHEERVIDSCNYRYCVDDNYPRELHPRDVVAANRAIRNWMAESLGIGKVKDHIEPRKAKMLKGGLD